MSGRAWLLSFHLFNLFIPRACRSSWVINALPVKPVHSSISPPVNPVSFSLSDEPSMSEMSHSNGIYSNLNEASPALGRQAGSNGSFALDHSGIPPQDQYHDLRSNSPYGIPPSPAALPALPGHQPLISSLVYPDNGLAIMGQSGQGVPQSMRVLAGNGPSSDLSTGSSGGYPDFPASPASWLDEVDHAQF